MKAKDMFEKLGYKQDETTGTINYVCEDDFIVFDKLEWTIDVYRWIHGDTESKSIDTDELKAIMAQAKELGWLDE